jgi:hypothetical protein
MRTGNQGRKKQPTDTDAQEPAEGALTLTETMPVQEQSKPSEADAKPLQRAKMPVEEVACAERSQPGESYAAPACQLNPVSAATELARLKRYFVNYEDLIREAVAAGDVSGPDLAQDGQEIADVVGRLNLAATSNQSDTPDSDD